jgi:hypothetical protein
LGLFVWKDPSWLGGWCLVEGKVVEDNKFAGVHMRVPAVRWNIVVGDYDPCLDNLYIYEIQSKHCIL